jgi:probable HAF family extracellular repeat protein
MYTRAFMRLSAICCIFGLGAGLPTANAQNLLTDLGPGSAYGINKSGQVVLSNGIWSNGAFSAFPSGFTGAAINASGEVAGNVVDYVGTDAATYSDGAVTVIGGVNDDPGIAFASAAGINDNGAVIGSGAASGGTYSYGFIYDKQQITTLLFPGSSPIYDGTALSSASSINDSGQVTGFALISPVLAPNAGISYHAFIYDSGTWTDIGFGEGFGINAAGQVTGLVGFDSDTEQFASVGHAFIYGNGSMRDLGTLPGGSSSTGYAINTAGQTVGSSSIAGAAGNHAFFYNGSMHDLNSLVSPTDPLQPYVVLTEARGINDNRLIVMNGIDLRTAAHHAYLLQGPWLDAAPGMLAFSDQAMGTVSSPQAVSLTNSGPTVLALGAISTSGDFSETNNCGASLAPGGVCTAIVKFAPTEVGYRTGALAIMSNGVPMAVPLAGGPIQLILSSNTVNTEPDQAVQLTWTATPTQASCTATGGSASDGWVGFVANSGTRSVAESAPGTYTYGLICSVGSQSESAHTSVTFAYPAVSVSIASSPTIITPGQSITLTWKSSNADTCVATGGSAGDNWPGAKSTNGSAMVTESGIPATPPLTLTFTLKCTADLGGVSASGNAVVIEDALPPPKSTGGGGGSFDPFVALFLAGLSALRGIAINKGLRSPTSRRGHA